MPFRPDPFLTKFERLRALREKRALGHVVAVASVAVASGVRQGFPELLAGVRFAPFYVAVMVSAAVGGGGPGLLALILSIVTATYLLPNTIAAGTPSETVAAITFLIIGGVMLTLIWLLNHAIDRIWHQAESSRLILEAQPAGVLGVDAEGRITLVNSVVERQLGYSREELFDQPVDVLVPLDARQGHAEFRKSYFDRPEPRMMVRAAILAPSPRMARWCQWRSASAPYLSAAGRARSPRSWTSPSARISSTGRKSLRKRSATARPIF